MITIIFIPTLQKIFPERFSLAHYHSNYPGIFITPKIIESIWNIDSTCLGFNKKESNERKPVSSNSTESMITIPFIKTEIIGSAYALSENAYMLDYKSNLVLINVQILFLQFFQKNMKIK